MKRLTLLLLLVCALTLIGFAHEFWLAPQKFFYSIRETANIRFHVGENFTGENWSGNRTKIQRLMHYTPSGELIDLSARLSDSKGDSLSLPLPETGTHMVIFNSTNSFIQLPPEKFNSYLHEDGLDEVAAYRIAQNETQSDGKEYYQRSVKTILQVGDRITDACTQPTGLPLDIIPESNPYNVPAELTRQGLLKVRFKILFRSQPLPNAAVKVWHQNASRVVQMDTLRTDKKGWISTRRYPGPVMVSCVYMERNRADTIASWQSYWGSVSFEYSQFFPGSAAK